MVDDTPPRRSAPITPRSRDRAIGSLFLAAFLLYGIGTVLATGTALYVGAALMLLNSMAVAAIGILVRPVLAPHDRRVGGLYLATRLIEAVLLGVGAVILIARGADETALALNQNVYHAGMVVLGLGSLAFCRVLIRVPLVPKALGWLGLVGYAIFAVGMLLDAAGHTTAGMILLIPGALFEISFGIWLIARGFASGRAGVAATG